MSTTRPLPFSTVTASDWGVSYSHTSGPCYRETELRVSRLETDSSGGPTTSVPHEVDGHVFDCQGDAEWVARMVGIVRPYRPATEGL